MLTKKSPASGDENAMISSLGLLEGLNQRSKQDCVRNNADNSKMNFLVYDREILLVQPNVLLISLAIKLVLFTLQVTSGT